MDCPNVLRFVRNFPQNMYTWCHESFYIPCRDWFYMKWDLCLDYLDEKFKQPIEEIDAVKFSEVTHFTVGEIYLLYELYEFFIRHRCISRSSGLIEHEMFLKRVPMFYVLPFNDRFLKIFSRHKSHVNFGDFIDMMSALNYKVPQSFRYEVLFNMYDFDEDGLISIEDIVVLLKRLCNTAFKEVCVKDEHYIETAFIVLEYGDKDGDGFLNLNEFKEMMKKTYDLHYFHISMTKRCQYRREDFLQMFTPSFEMNINRYV